MAGRYTPATTPNKRFYNGGSEWQDDIDGLAGYYSTFFREYDAVIGRFNGVDPMAEGFESWTTYSFSYNNPINFNDPLGAYTSSYTNSQSPSMRDILDRYSEDPFSSGWNDANGGGVGSYGEFKARLNYLGSAAWTIEQLEKAVREEILLGQKEREKNPNDISGWQEHYYEALRLITNAFPEEFDTKVVYDLIERGGPEFVFGEDFNNAYRQNKERDQTTSIIRMELGIDAFDKFANNNSEYWNFGELIRSIFHEFVHVYNHFGLKGYKQLGGQKNETEREFIAWSEMHNNQVLPKASIRARIVDHYQQLYYYNLLPQKLKEGYRNQIASKNIVNVWF